MARGALLGAGCRRRARTQVRRGPGHEVEGGAFRKGQRIPEISASNLATVLDAVPAERAAREPDALGLRLHPHAARPGEAPREEEQHGADAATEVGDPRGERGACLRGREPCGDEIVEGPAVPVEPLEDAPVASEVAEVLPCARPELRAVWRRGERGARRAPPGGSTRRADDARPGGGPRVGLSQSTSRDRGSPRRCDRASAP